MGLLDQIANPKVPSMMEQLKFQDMLESRQTRRRMAEIETAKAQQDFEMREEQIQGRQQGREIISEAVDSPLSQATSAIFGVPTEEIEQVDYTQLGNKLASVPGMKEQSKIYLNLGQKTKEFALKQTKEERDEAETLYELTANPMREVAKLEDAGKFDQAKEKYDQIIQFVLDDPRFEGNEKIQSFYEGVKEYKNGQGKFVFATTAYGKKARDSIGKTEKSEGVQERADVRAELARKRIAQSETRIEQTEKSSEQKQYRERLKTTTGLRKEYTKETEDISGALDQITLTRETLEQDKPLTDIMAKALLSKIANSKVRALAELEQYKNFGDLQGRVAGFFSRLTAGKLSVKQRKMAFEVLKPLEKMYQDMKKDSKDYFRYLANKEKLDSHAVAKYDSPDEIMGNKYLTDKEKIKLAEEVFPNFDWGP